MKFISIILFTFASLSVWAAPDLNQKISIRAKNKTAAEVIKEISAQANVKFEINPKINFTKKISISVKQASLKDVLDFIVNEQNVTWTAGDGNLIKIAPL